MKIRSSKRLSCGIRGRTYVTFYACIMHDLVNVICRHARLYFSRSDIQNFSCQSTDLAHRILFFLVQDFDLIPDDEFLQQPPSVRGMHSVRLSNACVPARSPESHCCDNLACVSSLALLFVG